MLVYMHVRVASAAEGSGLRPPPLLLLTFENISSPYAERGSTPMATCACHAAISGACRSSYPSSGMAGSLSSVSAARTARAPSAAGRPAPGRSRSAVVTAKQPSATCLRVCV